MSHHAPHHTPPSEPMTQEASTPMSDLEAQRFCEVFAEGLDSGMGYARIIRFLERKEIKPSVIQRMSVALLEEGRGLSETFTCYGLLDPPARRLVEVAEGQGTLPETLNEQAKIYRARHERKKKLVFGMVEPMIMALFAFAGLLPVIANLIELFEADGNIFILALQTMLGPMTVGMFGLLGFFGLAYLWLQAPVDMAGRQGLRNLIMRIPLVSRPSRLFSYSLFSRYFYSSIRGGLTAHQALKLAAESSGNPLLTDDLDRALHVLERGGTLEESFSAIRALPDDIIDYVSMGEETGRLEEMMLKGADLFEELAEQSFDRAMTSMVYLMRIVLIVCVVLVAFMGLIERLEVFDDVMSSI